MTRRPPLAPVMLLLLILAVLVLLYGCASGGVYQSSGKPAPAPEGWTQLCRDQPTYPGCKPGTHSLCTDTGSGPVCKPLNTTCSMAQCKTSDPIQCTNTC